MENRAITCSGPTVVLTFLGEPWTEWWRRFFSSHVEGRDTPNREGMCQTDGGRRVLEKTKVARVALDETIERGKHFLAENAADVESAIKAGRETMMKKMGTHFIADMAVGREGYCHATGRGYSK